MTNEDNRFTVNTTWAANEESVSLKEIISFEDFNTSEWSQLTKGDLRELSHLNSEETFVPLELKRRNKNEPCTLTIDLEDPCFKITKVILISEAKIIEIYGKYGEYISTEKAYFLRCFTGKEFYIAESNISGTKEITLKFHENDDTLWLYGITLLVVRNNHPTCNSIDFANVDKMLRSSNIHLTENAERAKAFIMKYNREKRNEQNKDCEMFQNLRKTWNALEKNNSSKITTTPLASNNGNNDCVVTTKNGNKENDSDLKQYVDTMMLQLEERIQNKLQLQLKEFEQKQNEKLDNIIQLLKNKN